MRVSEFVCVYVIRPAADGHELLLGLRAAGRYLANAWSLVTGSIEAGETAYNAAIREVREETGLAVRELYRLSPLTQFYRSDIDAICVAPMFCAIVDAAAEPVICAEHTSMEWVAVGTAHGRLMWPTDLAGLQQVREQILANGPAKPYLAIPLVV